MARPGGLPHTLQMPEYPDPMSTSYGEFYDLSTHLIAREVVSRGHTDLTWFERDLFMVEIGGRTYAWNKSQCNAVSTMAVKMSVRKDRTRIALKRAGVAVADGGAYLRSQYARAAAHAERIGWPVIVKPANSSKGRGVGVAYGPEDFAASWEAADIGDRIIVERRHVGDEARFLVVQGSTFAVVGRTPAHVMGDGVSSLADLVEAKNKLRSENPHLSNRLIRPDAGTIDLDRVPIAGEHVVLDHRGGLSSGADSRDMTEVVHSSWRRVAEQATYAIPGLGVAGVDIIATDWREPAGNHNHIVVEVNSRPIIGGHHFPWEGKSRNAAGAIVDACLPKRQWLPRLLRTG